MKMTALGSRAVHGGKLAQCPLYPKADIGAGPNKSTDNGMTGSLLKSFSLYIVGNRAESVCWLIFIWFELTSASTYYP